MSKNPILIGNQKLARHIRYALYLTLSVAELTPSQFLGCPPGWLSLNRSSLLCLESADRRTRSRKARCRSSADFSCFMASISASDDSICTGFAREMHRT